MRNNHGYTIVELLVIIATISILSVITSLTYIKVQQQSKDSQRGASATVVSEGLENYFSQHGEYPAVSKMTATNATTPKNLLGLTNIDSFITPGSPAGTTTNAWTTGTASDSNRLTYSANTDTSASCLTGTGASDVCEDYRIQYYKVKSATVETILSRNKAITPPVVPPPATPAATTITASLSGANATGTTTAAVCSGMAYPQYAFQSRTNDGAWSSYSAWGMTTSTSLAASQGVKYGFQVKARCVDGALISGESPVSSEDTYTHPITTPAAPTVVESTSGNISTWTWSVTSCPAGTTARYQYNFIADWGYSSPWYGPYTGLNTRTWDTESQGYEYIVQVQTHCYTAFATSNWSGTGQDAYIRPVSAPGPITFGISRVAANQVRVTASASCGTGVFLYSRADLHTWDYPWEDNGQYGWYASTHGGAWSNNTWGFHGPPAYTGSINLVTNLASGSGWNMATDMRCRNATTGRQSTTTGRVESARMNLP